VGEIAGILAAAAVAWFVLDSLRVRERAVALGKQACERGDVQFLDDTVQCMRTRFARNEAGRLVLRRRYRFEFSETGNNRRLGSIVMLGTRLESLDMEPYATHP
jgi:hypothetical protein